MPTLHDLYTLAAQARGYNEPPLFLGTYLFCTALFFGICMSVMVGPVWQLVWSDLK